MSDNWAGKYPGSGTGAGVQPQTGSQANADVAGCLTAFALRLIGSLLATSSIFVMALLGTMWHAFGIFVGFLVLGLGLFLFAVGKGKRS